MRRTITGTFITKQNSRYVKGTSSNTWIRTQVVLYCTVLQVQFKSCIGATIIDGQPYPLSRMLSMRRVSRRLLMDLVFITLSISQWNGITSLRFCGPYILCFRVRSVEAYPIPDNTSIIHPLPVLRYWFGPVSFRVMSLSHVRASRCPSGEVYSIFMLTNDVYQGMFHYRIRVAVSPVPSMSVHILAKGGIHMASDSLPSMPGIDIRYTQEDIIRQMFVATWSLGSAGLRGVWVDRQRGSIDRRVVAFTTRPPRLRTKGAHENTPDVTPENIDEVPSVEGNVVHVNSSYDLRGMYRDSMRAGLIDGVFSTFR